MCPNLLDKKKIFSYSKFFLFSNKFYINRLNAGGDILKNPRSSLFTAICAIAIFFPTQQYGQEQEIQETARPVFAEVKESEVPAQVTDCQPACPPAPAKPAACKPAPAPAKSAPCQTPCATQMPSPCQRRVSWVEIGGNYTYLDFKSDSTKFTGNLGGAEGHYQYQPLNNLYVGLIGLWRQGNTTTSSNNSTRFIIDVETQERVGYTFASRDEKSLVTLFTGVGYLYLWNNFNLGTTTTTGFNDLSHIHNEFYIPVGFLAEHRYKDFFSFGVNFVWMPQVNSTVTLIPINGAQWILKKEYGNYLVEVPFNFFWGAMRQFSFSAKPFYEYWKHGKSTAMTTSGIPLDIPEETYNYWGAEFNLGYKF